MGSSKYELSPEQFEKDMERNRLNYEQKKKDILKKLESIITQDYKQDDNFRLIIENLKELKEKYGI